MIFSFFSTAFSQARALPASEWKAEWVTDSKPAVADDSLLYQDNPAPLFRKEFLVSGVVKKAILYITGIGYYEASVNGVKIGDQYLGPGWTDYRKTIPYNVFDVTNRLRSGRSCLGVQLGNGWYNPLPLLMWGGLNIRKFLATGTPRLIARLEIEYKDGHSQEIVSDASWKVTDGPLRRNNNYIGSTYDDNYVVRDWNMPGVPEKGWRNVQVTEGPGGELMPQQHPPIRVREIIRPLRVLSLGSGKWLVDMGRNFGGIVRLKAKGKKGDRVVLRYGELLRPDGSLNVMTSVAGQVKRLGMGGPGAPPVAWQEDDLLLGDRELVFEPSFTFHGFRYVEVNGYPGELTAEKIQGIALASDVPSAGNFRCSDDMFNKIQDVTRHTFLSNLFSVQSDCPHREKLGYGGDIVATSEAFMANFSMHDFYAKTVRDFADDAMSDGGLTETAPYVGISDEALTRGSGPIGWGTVLPLLLQQLHQYYGDTGLIRAYYPVAKRWVDFLHTHADHYIISKGIGDHESVDPKQVEVTSTAFLYFNTHLLSELAGVLGLGDDEARYGRLADEVKKAFATKFYDPVTGSVGIHTEATQAFALYFHLLPAQEEGKALSVLLDQIKMKKEHVTTGIFGTKYLLEVLSEHGMSDLACRLVMQKDFPGWGNMLEHGATTLWEHWQFSDDTYSHNHPMFGSVSGWFYKYIAGIRPAPDAIGYDKVILQPSGFEYLGSAQAAYRSVHGLIRAAWKKKGDSVIYQVTVPAGVTGTVVLPGKIAMVSAGHYTYRVKIAGAIQVTSTVVYPLTITEKQIRKRDDHPRIVNIVNFIRWLEPRDTAITKDVLYETVVKQIELMKHCRLGGTFLLQYDALIDPRYQQLLRFLPRDSFEIGAWWELPQQLVEKAGLKWRGRYSWDWRADVGFAAGYSVEDRRKLVDVYMEDFKLIFGYYPHSVGSWYIDAYTLEYMYSKYGIIASCNCKDQVGTDGYTLWGGYWNQAYYPSKLSAYMPAQHIEHQIPVPIFRMLGSDPIRQYENGLGQGRQGVVTLEPVYKDAGGDSTWVQWFLKAMIEGPCMEYGYTQAGQENSFTWDAMGKGLEIQFPLIARLRDEGKLKVETLEASGEWFREHYAVTPATSVTVKEDLPGSDRKTVWFDSRWYRANFVWDKGTMRCRDLHLFDEGKPGDLPEANASTVSIMRTLPFIDGYMWSGKDRLAGMRLMVKEGGQDVELKGGDPEVTDSVKGKLFIRWPLTSYKAALLIELSEDGMRLHMEGEGPTGWYLDLVCSGSAKLPFSKISSHGIEGVFEGRKFGVSVMEGWVGKGGNAAAVATGGPVWTIHPEKESIALKIGK
jgi:hypothetical protein